MDKIYRVFISSTYEDLIEERKEVTQALLEMDCFPTGMELFQASNDTQWELIKRVIDSCDYYVVIVAGRYGSIHEETKKSFTQMEYEYALESGIPILGFIHKDLASLPHNKVDNLPQVREFIKIVKKKEVKYWSTPDELAGAVSRAMHHAMENYPRIGWVRDSSKSYEADIEGIVKRILDDRLNTPNVADIEGKLQKEDIRKKEEPQAPPSLSTVQTEHLNNVGIFSQAHDGSPIMKYSGSFYLDSLKSSALEEIANIVLSSGITAFTNMLDLKTSAGLPSYSMWQNCDLFYENISNNGFTNVFFDIWGTYISGCIVTSMPKEFLTKLYLDYVKQLSLKIPSKKEVEEFRQSMSTELGSIFTGACSTALSDCALALVRMGPSSFTSVEELFNASSPVYIATLPFNLNRGTSFLSYLLLDVESLKSILHGDDMFSNTFGTSNRVQKPSRWLR